MGNFELLLSVTKFKKVLASVIRLEIIWKTEGLCQSHLLGTNTLEKAFLGVKMTLRQLFLRW